MLFNELINISPGGTVPLQHAGAIEAAVPGPVGARRLSRAQGATLRVRLASPLHERVARQLAVVAQVPGVVSKSALIMLLPIWITNKI
jgi:hypothetical protein